MRSPEIDAARLAEGMDWLIVQDADMARIAPLIPPPKLRRRPEGFATLLHAIVGQQVSTASAAAIWARVEASGLTTPEAVQSGGAEALRACGFSRPKQRYALALAGSGLDYAALATQADARAVETLIGLPGIGRWTAEIYAMTALGRADVFPAGDLALQEAIRLLYGWEARPREAETREVAARWSPWRGVAARMLWEYYLVEKGREGMA